MRTNRNTRYNPKFADLGIDLAVIILSLFIAAMALLLFVRNLNTTLVRGDKTPVATMTFKYKSVQRRFLDRAVWDRPVQHSPVYNGDTIRTSPDAEATLYFDDTSVVEIGSSTMIQIFVTDKESALQLAGGAVSVRTGGESSMRVHSSGASVRVSQDSVLHADQASDSGLRLVMEKGAASFLKTDADPKAAAQPEILSAGQVRQEGKAATLIVTSPASNAKILNQNNEGEATELLFAWRSSSLSGQKLVLETARSSNFTREAQKFFVSDVGELRLAEKSGTLYWRLYPEKSGARDPSALKGKVGILSAPAPLALMPAPNSLYSYKEKFPPVRFTWKGNQAAASYLLEVADNPQISAPRLSRSVNTQSLTSSEFGEGVWYWRVTPRYLVGAESPAQSSRVSFFRVEKTLDLSPPQVIAPPTKADTAQSKDLSFSWESLTEARRYRLRISDNAKMDKPLMDEIVGSNYFKLTDAAAKLPNGTYYWTVAAIDQNGVTITETQPRPLATQDGQLVLRTVFPPDGYVLAEALCRDTRFTWKSNVNRGQRFQVSSSRDFAQLALDLEVSGAGIEGVSLKQGDWYWRVLANSGNEELKSEPAKLSIVPPLAKPEVLGLDAIVVVTPRLNNKVQWTAVPGADYYQVKISGSDPNAAPLYENLSITGTAIDMPLQAMKDGSYTASIQGFASPSSRASRRYGLATDHYFTLRRIKPIALEHPADKAQIRGLDAMLNPATLHWSSENAVASSELIVEKLGKKQPVLRMKNPGFSVQLPPLESGKYTWRVSAFTADGLDISAARDFSFSVLQIPPLAAVRFVFPKADEVLGVSFFKANRSIDFRWATIDEATHYYARIYDSAKRTIFTTEIPNDQSVPETLLSFKDILRLSRGVFYIEVKARRRLKNGILFQDGSFTTLKFEIDLPKSEKVETEETGVLYGK